jgi:predicted transcriptional regulator
MSDESVDVRERLREVMAAGGFTQVDVAKTIGTSQSVLSRFLRGDGTMGDTLQRIRAFLGEEEHPGVITHEDVRRAVRLYRFVKAQLDGGSQLIIRAPDGTTTIIIPMW